MCTCLFSPPLGSKFLEVKDLLLPSCWILTFSILASVHTDCENHLHKDGKTGEMGHKGMKSGMWTSWKPSPAFIFPSWMETGISDMCVCTVLLAVHCTRPPSWVGMWGYPQVSAEHGEGMGPKWGGNGGQLFSYLAGATGPLSSPGHGSVLGAEIRKGRCVCVRNRERVCVWN